MNRRVLIVCTAVSFCALHCSPPGASIKDSSHPGNPPAGKALLWKPSPEATEPGKNADFDLYRGMTFSIGIIADSRENASFIGYYLKDHKNPDTRTEIRTGSDIGAWGKQGIARALRLFAIPVADTNGIVIDGEVVRLTAEEQSASHGEIGLRLSVRSPAGMLIWEGGISGEATIPVYVTGGFDFSAALSDALVNALYMLLIDRSFRDAVTKSDIKP